VLTTDLRYVRKGITDWIKSWKNASEKPVKYQDFWKRLDELWKTHKVHWRCVKCLSGHLENKRADALANRGKVELGGGGCDK